MAEIADRNRYRELITPEGVDLRLRLGTVSERALALLIDLTFIALGLLLLTIATLFALSAVKFNAAGEAAAIIWLLGSFLARNFYFIAFECRPRAATPGKRIMGLRVASRGGGLLNANSIIARNALRELELYLPISFVIQRGNGVDGMIILSGILWCGVFLLLPLFNRDRLRAGDIVAGTWVVKTPKHTLLPDLATARERQSMALAFTETQLDVYGVKELQTLESVLRNSNPEGVALVAGRIRAKIGWPRSYRDTDKEFLNAYYAALRQRLEQRMLFGVRKEDKFDVG